MDNRSVKRITIIHKRKKKIIKQNNHKNHKSPIRSHMILAFGFCFFFYFFPQGQIFKVEPRTIHRGGYFWYRMVISVISYSLTAWVPLRMSVCRGKITNPWAGLHFPFNEKGQKPSLWSRTWMRAENGSMTDDISLHAL